jgi:uncharacterized protein YdeI (YjbR/CyaY-like superfamily)
MKKNDIHILSFKNQQAFSSWLEKKSLCYGWIDSLVNKLDQTLYIQKFTPRRTKSMWSPINIGHIERLTKEATLAC